jgi:Holliday junction resolvasome RuvABC endonuclease subunit
MKSAHIGLDPGSSSGGITIITVDGNSVPVHSNLFGSIHQHEGEARMQLQFYTFIEHTPQEIATAIIELSEEYRGCIQAAIEKVSGMPGQGVVSTFKFGKNAGLMMGWLGALKIPYEEVLPRKLQKYYSMKKNKGEARDPWKRRLLGRAQQLFPAHKIPTNCGDATLIAKYCRDNIKLI